MEQSETEATVVVPGIALALAVAAAICLGTADAVGYLTDTAERVSMLTWATGWLSLFWAALIGAAAAFSLSRRALSRRPVARLEPVLVAAALALVVVLMTTHPLWGSGSASA